MLMKWRTFSETDSGWRKMLPNSRLILKCSWPGKSVTRRRVAFVAVVVAWRRDGVSVAMTGDC